MSRIENGSVISWFFSFKIINGLLHVYHSFVGTCNLNLRDLNENYPK